MTDELLSAAVGCAFVWAYLQILNHFEGQTMAALVGIGLIGRVFYAIWKQW